MSYQAPDIYANGSVSPQQNSQPVISHANRGYLLYLFIIISSATTITAAACIMSLMFLLVGAVSSDEPLSASIVVHVAIQVYEMITLIGIVVVEMEWTEAIRNMSILQSWGVRGLSYSFVGLLVFQELGAFEVTENSVRYPYLEIPSIILICLGAVYSVMGVLCLKRVRDSKMARYIQLLSHFEVQNVIKKNASSSRSMLSIATTCRMNPVQNIKLK